MTIRFKRKRNPKISRIIRYKRIWLIFIRIIRFLPDIPVSTGYSKLAELFLFILPLIETMYFWNGHVWDVPGICLWLASGLLTLILDLAHIRSRFDRNNPTWYMYDMCFRYSRNMHGICPEKWVRYDMHVICPRYARDLGEIFQR